MKEFIKVNSETKVCPECKQLIPMKWTAAFSDEWCPNCGCNMEEVFPKVDVKEKDFGELPIFDIEKYI